MSRAPRPHAGASLDAETASRWHPEDLERLADLVAERVVERLNGPRARRLVSASELAQVLGVSRATVYQYGDLLGARRLGSGRRSRLRFDLDAALAAWTSREDSRRSDRARADGYRQSCSSRPDVRRAVCPAAESAN